MTYTYIPKGVCSRKMTVELNDDHTIQAVRVEGGCNGNLQGISRLVVGMDAQEAIRRMRGRVGETVPGIVRSCKPYGCFVELTPNLSGLADSREDIPEGRLVSVYIRSIQPQTGKIKLQMVQELGQPDFPTPLHYQITGGSVSGWRYRP